MEEHIQREIEAIRGMVLTWKRKYLEWATPDGGNDFLVGEFMEELATYVLPFVRRMTQVNYLTMSEAREFLNSCYREVEDLRNSIEELEPSK